MQGKVVCFVWQKTLNEGKDSLETVTLAIFQTHQFPSHLVLHMLFWPTMLSTSTIHLVDSQSTFRISYCVIFLKRPLTYLSPHIQSITAYLFVWLFV